MLARERRDQRIGDRRRRRDRGRELRDRREPDVAVAAPRREQLRLHAVRREQAREPRRGVPADLRVVRVERGGDQRGRARVALAREHDQLVDRGLAQIGRPGDRLGQRGERAGRVQRAQRRHRALPHEVMRIADGVPEHRQHRVGADRVLARELEQPADRFLAHAVGLVGLGRARRLPHQPGVHAEHQALRRRRVDIDRLADAHEQPREIVERGRVGIAVIGDQPAEPAGGPRDDRLARPAGVGHEVLRRPRDQRGLAPERERLRAQREHLGRGVAPDRVVAGDRVGEHLEQGRAAWRRRPVAGVRVLRGRTGADQLADDVSRPAPRRGRGARAAAPPRTGSPGSGSTSRRSADRARCRRRRARDRARRSPRTPGPGSRDRDLRGPGAARARPRGRAPRSPRSRRSAAGGARGAACRRAPATRAGRRAGPGPRRPTSGPRATRGRGARPAPPATARRRAARRSRCRARPARVPRDPRRRPALA